MSRRLYVLGGVLAAIAVLAAVILLEVLGTVFLALTVAYLLVPLRRRLRERGLSRRLATATVTTAAVVGVIALSSPLVYLLVARLSEVIELVRGLPEAVTLDAFGVTYDLLVDDLVTAVVRELRLLAGSVAAALPVLLVKLTLFVLLVFSLLHNQRDIQAAVLAVVPPSYRDVAEALHARARDTLFALYVLQAATALGTFLIALPVFLLFGYESPVVLAIVAAVLQFVPVAGPSILIAALAVGHVLAGDLPDALLIALVGGGLIAWLPDILIRPRLASRTANLSGSLYFIGFVGGLLSMGAIGIIVGPLVVALLVETADLVSDEFDYEPSTDGLEPSTDEPNPPTDDPRASDDTPTETDTDQPPVDPHPDTD